MSKVFLVTYDLTKDSDHQNFKEKLVKELGYQKELSSHELPTTVLIIKNKEKEIIKSDLKTAASATNSRLTNYIIAEVSEENIHIPIKGIIETILDEIN